mmetsp:Transcript_1543/g.1736  ORF Transcript_1543/g.1736 Transcript_1543/m.1736 type:complete len:248 (-) Transcript_1543:38-781(-)
MAESNQRNVVLVVGATGGLGRLLVAKLQAQQYSVRALVSDKTRASELLGDDCELIEGDVSNIESIKQASKNVQHCIYTASGKSYFYMTNWFNRRAPYYVDYMGVKNVADELKRQEFDGRFLLVSSMFVTRPYSVVYILLQTMVGGVMSAKRIGEQYLRSCGLNYTIVRPGGLVDKLGSKNIQIDQGDNTSGSISREDVASVCIEALTRQETNRTTFEIISKDGPTPESKEDFDDLFKGLDVDAKASL